MVGDNYFNIPELLVMMIQNIKEDPFEKLMRICDPITYSVVNRYFFSDYEREDILQEARSVLIEATETFRVDEGMPFLQYYHMSLSNHFNMLLRKKHAYKRRINMETSSLDELIENAGLQVQGTSSNTTQPEEATITKETYSNYLIELSPFEKKIFFLFLEGVPQKEIAQKLDIKLRKVQNALHRCSIKLKTAINK